MSDYKKLKKPSKNQSGIADSLEEAASESRKNSPFGDKDSGGYYNLKKSMPVISDALNPSTAPIKDKDNSDYKKLKQDDNLSSSHRNRFQKLKAKMSGK
jgi:hypothetical protein